FLLLLPTPPRSTLFPYTTLFRSFGHLLRHGGLAQAGPEGPGQVIPHLAGAGRHARPVGGPGNAALSDRLEAAPGIGRHGLPALRDRKSTRLNSSHVAISYAVFCL